MLFLDFPLSIILLKSLLYLQDVYKRQTTVYGKVAVQNRTSEKMDIKKVLAEPVDLKIEDKACLLYTSGQRAMQFNPAANMAIAPDRLRLTDEL